MSGSSHRRVGFTLVELLVVITIIGMLIALLLPAIGAVRATMRKTECSNRLRNLGQATINHATTKGTLPGYIQPVLRDGGGNKAYVMMGVGGGSNGLASSFYTSTNDASPASRLLSRVSWAAILLPRLDRNDIWERIVDSATNPNSGSITEYVRSIDVFVCPDDTQALSSPDNAALSYIANSGGWGWTNGATVAGPATFLADSNANGLFHNLTDGKTTSKLEVNDGAATTLMFSENIHKDDGYSWLGVEGAVIAEAYFGMVWVVNETPGNGDPSTSNIHQVPMSKETVTYISNRPAYARPASSHSAGSCNVVFVDGHTTSIQPEIDYKVYQALLTPNGRKCVDPVDWTVTAGAINAFRTAPPLSEKDFAQ